MVKKLSIETKVESESIIHGEPLTDKKSTFQAHVAEVIPATIYRKDYH